jgi:hypothetical protein
MRYWLLVIAATALLSLACCSRSPEIDASRPAQQAPAFGIAEFEQSAFYRRHPPKNREDQAGAIAYRFVDPYGESRDIVVQFAPGRDRIRAITVTWHADRAEGAGWSSIKKQFMADLLESTFWDVDYGQVSSYMMEQGKAAQGGQAVPMAGGVSIVSAAAGSDLTLRLER